MNLRRLLTILAGLTVLCFGAACAEETVFRPADLPVVYLELDGGKEAEELLNESPDHSYRCAGTMDILVPEGYSGQFEGRYPQESVRGLKMEYIRGRGNGTWGMSKHPYRIKLAEKQNLFGMGKNKHWVLLANYFDNSLIRNWLTGWIGEQMGMEYTPEGVFVEVVMNGEYLGSYYLCEQVRVGKNRVDIDELKAEDTRAPEIQGGYLLEFSPDDWESPDTFETSRGLLLGNMEPSFDPEDDGYANDAQKNYIRNYVQQAEDAVFSEAGNYADFIDVRSLADYWWIMEFSANEDAFRTDSAHMFKPRTEADGSEGKLHFGPLWDFDAAWGNDQTETRQDIGFNNTYFSWAEQLRTRPEFRELLRERWQKMDALLEEFVREGGILDRLAAIVRDSWYRDRERWQEARAEDGTDIGRNFEEEIEHLRGWINLRREWINTNMERLGLISFTLTVRGEGMEERTYSLACDTTISIYDVEIPEIEGKEFTGWAMEDGTLVEDFLLMDRDVVLTAVFE